MTSQKKTGSEQDHSFGGEWTALKLKILSKYLRAYTMALKKQPFRKAYIDAFAGTGYRSMRNDDNQNPLQLLFLNSADATSQEELLDGSARIALKSKPRFEKYIFIERSQERCDGLSLLKGEFPDLAQDILIRQGDANTEIRALCAKNWDMRRAVLFLDPYGMQVEWQTIEAVAKTKAIDLWLLFPLGIGVNRLLTRSGEIPVGWRRRLNILLGTEDWYDEFYRVEYQSTLFGDDEARVVKATVETIGRYFNDRLRTIFAGVADEPGVLRNSTGCPLYLFCFAVGNPNPKAIKAALNIANDVLKGIR